ncbi:MAG TPA: molybdate ABC transporter substrate-binding protein, partial [Fimbriimonadaceae bacterium]|nr:molybdate ABC transporter substrate-binding protein [Fimbriimonadaceae bacterium]
MLAVFLASAAIARAKTLDVFAAASLKEAFTRIAREYEAAHPGLTVRLNFAGSQTLAAQINQGAPADVFASADERNLDLIRFDKPSRRIFVLNKLEIAVRNGLAGIRSPRDLFRVKDLVVADPAVPVGMYTEGFFAKAARLYGTGWLTQVRSHIVSREQDVKAVLAKVVLGEADAGIVYVSDVATAGGKVQPVPIPDRLNLTASYPAAVPSESANKDEAKHFIKFVLSDGSQHILEQSGF